MRRLSQSKAFGLPLGTALGGRKNFGYGRSLMGHDPPRRMPIRKRRRLKAGWKPFDSAPAFAKAAAGRQDGPELPH
jgi:hypothetical protein